jgi:hypothetical protein
MRGAEVDAGRREVERGSEVDADARRPDVRAVSMRFGRALGVSRT